MLQEQAYGLGRVVVTLPAEIDMSNSGPVGDQLRAAIRPGLPVLIADMTFTTFIDSAGIRALVPAARAGRARAPVTPSGRCGPPRIPRAGGVVPRGTR